MTAIAIFPESSSTPVKTYRAVSGQKRSVGRTPGEALDSMAAQLEELETGTMIIVQQMRADSFFTEDQRLRLGVLMDRWRATRDAGAELPVHDQAELDTLARQELEAATNRSAALLSELRS